MTTASLDRPAMTTNLDERGWTTLDDVFEECASIAAMYADERLFRSHINMAQHGFFRGEYKYFANPLPSVIREQRSALYEQLVPIANRWNAATGIEIQYPAEHRAFLERCHNAGQTRPTPLLLRYGPGDFNALHHVHGEHLFPLQVAILLSEPVRDFIGGEFLLVEQRPRMQPRGEVIPRGPGGTRD